MGKQTDSVHPLNSRAVSIRHNDGANLGKSASILDTAPHKALKSEVSKRVKSKVAIKVHRVKRSNAASAFLSLAIVARPS
jgi:hypothetical protein